MPDCASLVITVTTSTATVESDLAPALVAPVGAARVVHSVRPVGMFVLIAAVTFAVLWFVVTAQVLVAEVTDDGPEPAVAVLITSDGEPVTAIWLMASTWNATDCVAVVCARAAAAEPTIRASAMTSFEEVCIKDPKVELIVESSEDPLIGRFADRAATCHATVWSSPRTVKGLCTKPSEPASIATSQSTSELLV